MQGSCGFSCVGAVLGPPRRPALWGLQRHLYAMLVLGGLAAWPRLQRGMPAAFSSFSGISGMFIPR